MSRLISSSQVKVLKRSDSLLLVAIHAWRAGAAPADVLDAQPVTALVVFVGEWKEKWCAADARVVSESQLLRYFDRQDQPELLPREIKLIAPHLERSAKSA